MLEDLRTMYIMRMTRGTIEVSGPNVRAKAVLNRVILATGWFALAQMLRYIAPRVVLVGGLHTSPTCYAWGDVDTDSRVSQALFR